ncbi:hypothetical protein Tco_0842569 [Tanacetum coccineum]|uniref:Uncharacterized protein n=1 Tax=Tanacetum coccineum TaxID=301880 RepID=A0ABQ5B2C4_9ASTR
METKDTLSSCSNTEEQQMQQIQDKAKKSCMVSFRLLHSHLKLLSNNDLKGTRTECGFKRAFATLFGQDIEIFTGTMFLNMDQLEKQLDKEEFQEIGSMTAFKYFLEYTQLEIREFRDTLIQHIEYVKKSIDKRALYKRDCDSMMNERQMQTIVEKVDTSKALDASLVDTESSGTEFEKQDTSSRLGNDAHADDADIRPTYDEEPMVVVQMIAEINVFAIGQQHVEQPEFNNEGEVDQNAEQCHDIRSLPAKLTDNRITELSYQSLKSENIFTTTFFLRQENPVVAKPHHILHSGSSEPRCDASARSQAQQMVPSHKTTKRYKPVEQMSIAKKPERQIPTGHRFLIKKTSSVHKKTMNPRSCLGWKQTGRIFKTVGLWWVPTGKIFTSSTTKVNSEPINGSNEDITNQYECEQTLDVSAGTLNLSAVKCKAGSKVVPSVDKTTTSQQELELLFSPMYEEYFNAGNPSVSKSSALYDNLQQHDTQPTTNSHPTLEPINPPTNVNAEKNM